VLPRILDGTPTTGHPEVGAVGLRDEEGDLSLCSGTLIAPTVVLTAAHCLVGQDRAGVVFFPEDGSQLQMLTTGFVMHPDYRGRTHADIGLVFLSSPAGGILPARLAERRPRNRHAEIVGFGADASGPVLVKRVGTVKVMRRCPRRGRRRVGLLPGELVDSICFKPKPGGNDTCAGDSGGPMFIDGVVAGVHAAKITRSPIGCPSSLAWDTDVAKFRDWIDAEVARATQ
jgi:transmembrane serine protease 9